jgi:hypothetical protein
MSKKILRPVLSLAAVGLTIFGGPLGTIVALGAKIGVGALAGLALGVASAVLLRPKVPRISPNATDRLTASLDPNAPRKIAFGHTALATDVRYQGFTGTDQEYVEWILAVASHEVEAIQEIWFDAEKAWSASGGVTSKYSGYLTVTTRNPGASGNGIAIDSTWTTSCTLTGCAYLHLKFKVTGNSKKAESPFSSSIPSRVTVRGKGALLPDLREDGVDPDDQTTWDWFSDDSGRNPAWQLLFYLLGWRINGKLAVGRGIPSSRIDLESFITAANLCDEPVTKAAGGTEPRYRCDALFSEGDDPDLVIGGLCDAMNAILRDTGGKIGLYVLHNDLATPVCAFTEADIIGDDQWQQTPGIDQTTNIVRGRYVDASDAGLYQLVDYPDAELESVDGIDRIDNFDLPCVQSASQAQRLAKQRLQRNQYRGVFQARFNYRAWQVNLGDVVTLSHSALGWEDKLFRVAGTSVGLNGVVDLILREENEAIYAWDAEEAAPVTPATPTIYDPTKSAFNQALDEIELTPGPQGDPGAPGADAHGLIVTGDRSQITYDGSGSLSPTTQTTTLTAQGSNLPAFDLFANAISWSMARADGTVINPASLADASGVGHVIQHWFPWSERLDNWNGSTGSITVERAATPSMNVPIQMWDLTDSSSTVSATRSISRSGHVPANSTNYTFECFVAKTSGKTTRSAFLVNFNGGTTITYSVYFNSSTGEIAVRTASSGTPTDLAVQDYGDCWRISFRGANNGTNTNWIAAFYPAMSGLTGGDDPTATGTETVGGFQMYESSGQFVSYVKTGDITGGPWTVMRSPVVSISAANFDSARGTTNGLTITAAATVAPSGSTPGRLVYGTWALTKTQDGAAGLNNAVVRLYQRAASSPAAPTGTFTYTFATGVLSGGTLNGWTQAIPAADGNPLYVIAATASSTGATDSIAATEFTSPVIQDGAGLNSATVFLFQRAASVPSVPDSTLTYTFATGVLSGTLGSWTQAVPPHDGNPLYVITATALSAGTTDTIAPGEWASPQIHAEDGISPVLVTASPAALVIKLNADGSVASGELPATVEFAAVRAGAAVSVTAVSVSGAEGCTASVSSLVGQVTALSGTSGQIVFAVTADGEVTNVTVPFSTAPAGTGGGASATKACSLPSSTSYADISSGGIAINANASGALSVNLTGFLRAANGSGNERQIVTKIQVSTTGGSSWTDVSGSEHTSEDSVADVEPPYIANKAGLNGSGPYSVTGLGANTACLVRAMGKNVATPTGGASATITLYAGQP